MRRDIHNRPGGFVVSLELILIVTFLVIGSLVGVIAVRNALFQLAAAKRAFEIVVKDADDPPLRVKPVSYDLCEAPEILCRDPGFDEDNLATPGPSEGLFALVGVRATHLVSRNRVYFSADGCSGNAYLAPPAAPDPPASPGLFPPVLPVGYFNCALQVDDAGDRVCYGVGPPSNYPCTPLDDTAGAGCADGGRLYRNESGAPVASTTVRSQWISLNPDCAGLGAEVTSLAFCEDFGDLSLDLVAAVEVTQMDGTNVLAPFTPLFNVMPPPDPTVTFTPAVGEDAPIQDSSAPGSTTTPGADPTFPDASPEDDPP